MKNKLASCSYGDVHFVHDVTKENIVWGSKLSFLRLNHAEGDSSGLLGASFRNHLLLGCLLS
jgi:hypothetical protein